MCHLIGVRAVRHLSVIYLTDGQNVVDVQALEERPHREVDVDEAAAKVKAAGESRDDLEARLRMRLGVISVATVCAGGRRAGDRGVRTGGRVKADELAGARGRVREDLGDLERVRLHVL